MRRSVQTNFGRTQKGGRLQLSLRSFCSRDGYRDRLIADALPATGVPVYVYAVASAARIPPVALQQLLVLRAQRPTINFPAHLMLLCHQRARHGIVAGGSKLCAAGPKDAAGPKERSTSAYLALSTGSGCERARVWAFLQPMS